MRGCKQSVSSFGGKTTNVTASRFAHKKTVVRNPGPRVRVSTQRVHQRARSCPCKSRRCTVFFSTKKVVDLGHPEPCVSMLNRCRQLSFLAVDSCKFGRRRSGWHVQGRFRQSCHLLLLPCPRFHRLHHEWSHMTKL